jgi:hypothetical protein
MVNLFFSIYDIFNNLTRKAKKKAYPKQERGGGQKVQRK